MQPQQILEWASRLSTPVIGGAAVFHLVLFFYLIVWSSRDLRRMAADLESFTRGLKHRSALGPFASLPEQVSGFLADVQETLETPQAAADRAVLLERIKTLDERRRYLQSNSFETWYNVCRTMIEAYPLAGVLGTVLAIGAALYINRQSGAEENVTAIVRYFGDAIWATFAGLLAAMSLMFVNSLVEPRFRRLIEYREQVRATIAHAKRQLTLATEPKP